MINSDGGELASKFDEDDDACKYETEPDHLLVLVHGIMASRSDWTFAETVLKRTLGNKYLIYASSSNGYTKTFSGIGGAGRRLAEEVSSVVEKRRSLKKISFLAHSLGGLFVRYAIAVLYASDTSEANLYGSVTDGKERTLRNSGTIAGLEPVTFITLATPHLGVRGKGQLPLLFGVPVLEKLAPSLAPILTGQTGRQLFLADGKPSKPPLLLRMASDSGELKFL